MPGTKRWRSTCTSGTGIRFRKGNPALVVVHARMVGNPDKRNELLAAIPALTEATRAEAGCISYTFYEDTENPNHFIFVEEWESQEALGAHTQTPHFGAFMKQSRELFAAKPQIKVYTVADQ